MTECGSKASASRVFINFQKRACTSGRVECTAESASVYCGQTHVVEAGDLDYQMMVSYSHPFFILYPCSLPPALFFLSLSFNPSSFSLSFSLFLSLPLFYSLRTWVHE